MIRVFTSKTQAVGERGEEAAVAYLTKNGYKIRERNFACMFGEIDIVATRKGICYFFEVKAGQKGGWINPAENLTKAKLQKFLRSVAYYCLKYALKDYRAQGIIVLFDEGIEVELVDLF